MLEVQPLGESLPNSSSLRTRRVEGTPPHSDQPRYRTTETATDPSPEVENADLHQAVILDHFRHPRNHGRLTPPALEGTAHNPFCGDTVQIWARLRDGRLDQVTFDGRGCTISQAAASIVSEITRDKTPAEVAVLRETFAKALATEGAQIPGTLGDLRALSGVRRFPSRVRCAMLAFEALEAAIGK